MGFSFDSFQGVGRVFPLRGDHEPIVLDDSGIQHPRNQRSPSPMHTAYSDVTHWVVSPRVLWLGTRESVYVIPRVSFVNYDGPDLLAAALREKIADQPGGQLQLDRIAEIDRINAEAGPPVVTRALIGICIAVFMLQGWLGIGVSLAGELIPELVADGDLWRVITANLLHGPGLVGVIHIALNMLVLLPLGTLVERPLGPARMISLMVFSGIGSMLAATWFSTHPVVGASGIVFGLAGAVLWLDFKRSDQLPASWRFPRRNLIGLVLINGVIGAVLPIVAFAAHAGGLVGGAVAAAILTGRISAPAPLRTRAVSVLALLVTFLAVATAAVELTQTGDAQARHAIRVSGLPNVSPGVLNDKAWLLATSMDPKPTQLGLLAALALAERAVSETDRSDATILDTLAEVHFQIGNAEAALAIIDEAILLDPGSTYFVEQRRRFTGERGRNDRPDYLPPMFRGGEEPEPAEPPLADGELTV